MPKSQKTPPSGLTPKSRKAAPTGVVKPSLTTVKKNRHGRCFKTHLRLRHKALIGLKPIDPLAVAVKMDLAARKQVAVDARKSGAVLEYPFGGSYDIVAAGDKEVRSLVYLEANHSPPLDSYVDTPYAGLLSDGAKPAHAMLFYHHRAPRGLTGGLTSTGGSSFNKAWAEKLRVYMRAGQYAEAMYWDFNDVLATTTPNRGYYALALHRCALYARSLGLIDETGLRRITTLYGQYLSGDSFGVAFTDADESF